MEKVIFTSYRTPRSRGVTTELQITQTCILNLTTIGLFAIISGFNTLGSPAELAPVVPVTAIPQSTVEITNPKTTQEKVREYFSDIPVLIDIAKCESRFRHLDLNGDVIRGEINYLDVGVMQINEKYHLKESKKLGFDIHSLEGNMAYARYLYENEGARPWLSSSKCWAKYTNIAKI